MIFKIKNTGFTLIELLFVFSIIGIMSAVIVTQVSDAKERARIASVSQFAATLQHSLGASLVAEYNMEKVDLNNINVTKVYDSSGHNHHSTSIISPVRQRTTPAFLSYNGSKAIRLLSGSRVFFGNVPEIPETDYTVSFWFKTIIAGQNSNLIYFGSGTTQGDRMYNLTNGKICATLNSEQICSNENYNDSLYHQVLHIVDSEVGQTLFVDGKLVATGLQKNSSDQNQDSMIIGNPSITLQFDEIRVYSDTAKF